MIMTELKTALHNMFRMMALSVVSLVLSGCDGGLCLFGDGSSCFSAGSQKERLGYHAEAADYFGKGCALGDSPSCNRAGEIWTEGVVPANYYKAVEMFQAGCKKGFSDSCRRLGLIYREQFGDHQKSLRMIHQACRMNNQDACNDLGLVLREGFVMPPDDATAMDIFAHGCHGDNASSCFFLAGMLEERRMSDKAFVLYHKSCTLKHGSGCNRVGEIMVKNGESPTEAGEFFRKSCDLDFANGCFNLAELFFHGMENQKFREAVVLYSRACRLKHGHSCHILGEIMGNESYYAGDNVNMMHNMELSSLYLQKSCELKDGDGCNDMGTLYYSGERLAVNRKEARRFFWLACNYGNADGCVRLGHIYQDGIDVSPDGLSAEKYYLMACDRDNGEGCFRLASIYMKSSDETNENRTEEAYRYAQQSCSLDFAEGCRAVGEIFDRGIGRELDVVLADKYYDVACRMNDGASCFYLGVAYYSGRGVPQDYDISREYVMKSCEMGYAQGCTGAGIIYLNGKNVEVDEALAIKYLTLGCSLKDGDACYNIGVMYERGNGVPQDTETSKRFYGAGCDLGNTEACFAYDDPSSREPPADKGNMSEKEDEPAASDEGVKENTSAALEKVSGGKTENAAETGAERENVRAEDDKEKDADAEQKDKVTVSSSPFIPGNVNEVSGGTNDDDYIAGGSVPEKEKKVKKSGSGKKTAAGRKNVHKRKS